MADPWWLPGCKENLAKIPGGVLCTDQHCTDAQNYYHAVCNCQPPYQNGCPTPPTPNCCSYSATSPILVLGPQPCYCCCGCFANGTLIAVNRDDTRPVQDFLVGDQVRVAMNPQLTEWAQIPVAFSSGTGPESQSPMIQIRFGDDANPETIIATREQLFLVTGQKLKRASKLVPDVDQLIRADGSAAKVLDMTAGVFTTGVHQIATTTYPTTNMAGHLLVANGVVCGDYSLQVTDLDSAQPQLMAEGHAKLPEFGTKAYAQRHAHLFASAVKAHPTNRVYRAASGGGFEPFELAEPVAVPKDATSFFTQVQAADIEQNAPRQPVYSGAGKDITNYLFKLYKGFYPAVSFYLDEANELPNAYAFFQYGVPFVVVNGGLVRTDVVQYESLAFIMAHQLSVLYGGEPKDDDGYTCKGQADYAAILAIFPYVWFGLYAVPLIQPAIDQITKLFAFIDPDHRGGKPGNTCDFISIDCRLEAMAAAANTQNLPECAGGPPTPTLEVTGAVAGSDGASVTVSFNEAVDPQTAERVGSYEFTPLAPASAATVSADALSVTVQAAFTPSTDYVVRVQDVLSADGHPIVQSKSRAKFKTPATTSKVKAKK
jgi:hypothetical protein